MKMPFNGLKLLDYAINSALAFSNVALKRNDKTGLISFSKQIENFVPAVQKITHLNTILEQLYNIETAFTDADFGLLYGLIKRKVNHEEINAKRTAEVWHTNHTYQTRKTDYQYHKQVFRN